MKRIAYLFVFLLFAGSAHADQLVRFSAEKKIETITLALPKGSPHKIFTVPDPDRLVVDVASIAGHHEVALPSSYKGKFIKAVRFGQFDPKTSRFVFDLNKPVKVSGVSEKKGKLIIQLVAGTEANIEASAKQEEQQEASPSPKENRLLNAQSLNSPQKVNAKPLIVLDPGHGGVDPGTIGHHGTYEKDVVLAIAKTVKARLLKTGRYNVMLTRDDDRFIMLRERVAIARKAKASIFISLHADSSPGGEARGLSVYTVSEKASDKEAEALAARENKADVLAGMDLSQERPDVADILISLAERETKNRSATLADTLVQALDAQVRLLPNSHRFAGFAVLKAPDIPSVLIETGFLSEPQEEKMLQSKAYREKVAAGIAAGIDHYFAQVKKGNTQ